MANNAIKWEASWTSRGTVLTTELNSLAAASTSAAGTEIANSTNLDQYGKLVVSVDFASAPTAGGFLDIFMITAPDGTNYDDVSVAPGSHTKISTIPIVATASAQIIMSGVFMMQPAKTKFLLKNSTDQAFPASGSTVTLYTCNDEIQ